MKSNLMPLGPPVSRDRVISNFPKWYTPEACLQLREHFHEQVKNACQRRNTGTVGLKVSKVVVVGDLCVGKTSLINSWDTAGQEKFKCIASSYYRGAQVIITAFDLADIQTLEHTKFPLRLVTLITLPHLCSRQWLEDALRENEPDSSLKFLVGTKKDLLSGAVCERSETDAIQVANEMQAEYWSVSAKTGENVKNFFSRVAAVTFEQSVLRELEKRGSCRTQIGEGNFIKIEGSSAENQERSSHASPSCC
ncbi:ras-related protein Rab-36 isoform X3 [Tachyglossus aculeatus]|uniref:ras-related protein Rab-36 isoform X3 n=1 Tax=Tachyglossus aculeatus TaxID=9261 RepID=UPI0018F5B587|nr:ras-related protein Rab-36 isoform X3 [Tachyglossus aculeatus]